MWSDVGSTFAIKALSNPSYSIVSDKYRNVCERFIVELPRATIKGDCYMGRCIRILVAVGYSCGRC